jgi:hypothetical protein
MCKKFGQAGQDKDKTCLFAPVKNIVKKLKKKFWTEQIEKKQISSLNVSLNVQFGPMDRVFSFFLFLIFSNLLKHRTLEHRPLEHRPLERRPLEHRPLELRPLEHQKFFCSKVVAHCTLST